MVKKKKRLSNIIHDQLPGLIMGALVSGGSALIVWLFAYFGYTDLGLPQRFNYEKMNHVVNSYLPDDFNKREIKISNFRQGGDETLVYTGQLKEFYYGDKDKASDIILFFDKTDDKYRLSYRFSPVSSKRHFPLHVEASDLTDLNNDGRDDLVVAFAEMGAHWAPPLLAVIYSDGNNISVAGAPRGLSSYKSESVIKNTFDSKQKIAGDRADIIFAGNGMVAYVTRTDDACYACGDEHVFNIDYLKLLGDELIVIANKDVGIRGYDDLLNLLSEKGIKPLKHATF